MTSTASLFRSQSHIGSRSWWKRRHCKQNRAGCSACDQRRTFEVVAVGKGARAPAAAATVCVLAVVCAAAGECLHPKTTVSAGVPLQRNEQKCQQGFANTSKLSRLGA